MTRKRKRVVIYVRISKSRTEQTSLASQEDECRRWAEGMGWEIVAVFIENGRSAYKKNVKRPEFDKAMSMIERDQADVFLVWKLDRFYRDGSEFNTAWGRINKVGAEFASVMEPWIDTTSAMGRWQVSGIAYQAEIESENRSQRTKAWNRTMITAEDGAYVPGGSVRPYGFDRTAKGVLTINDDEATIIRDAAEMIRNDIPLRSALRELKPVSTRRKDDGTDEGAPIAMTHRGLRHVLTNPTTYGLRRTETGSLIKGCWSPVLPRELYGSMCAHFDDPDRKVATTNQIVHLLSGIITCGNCTAKVGIRKWKQNASTKNKGIEKHRYTCECGNSIDEANANAVVLTRMWETVTPEVWQGWRVEGHGYDVAIREGIESRIEKLDMMFLQGKIEGDRYEAMNATLRDQLQLSMSNEPLDIPNVDDIEASWEELSVKDKRKVIKQAFESITLNPANGTRNPIKRLDIK